MEIKTKYDIGQHIWFVYESQHEVCIYDDYIGMRNIFFEGI